ncbi:NF-kappa-B essential modulator-like protein [Mycolicibacterium canariasense]|uniref:NF-kappa-B essential modulator-like protein n=1 Tax=Mycolicibacterium canariasense TaxID=228230 RepID=A0A124E2X1_MYCCR|nr:NF-kappa-B essential modulator-like protein [Mycolicibacterium canariasense]
MSPTTIADAGTKTGMLMLCLTRLSAPGLRSPTESVVGMAVRPPSSIAAREGSRIRGTEHGPPTPAGDVFRTRFDPDGGSDVTRLEHHCGKSVHLTGGLG